MRFFLKLSFVFLFIIITLESFFLLSLTKKNNSFKRLQESFHKPVKLTILKQLENDQLGKTIIYDTSSQSTGGSIKSRVSQTNTNRNYIVAAFINFDTIQNSSDLMLNIKNPITEEIINPIRIGREPTTFFNQILLRLSLVLENSNNPGVTIDNQTEAIESDIGQKVLSLISEGDVLVTIQLTNANTDNTSQVLSQDCNGHYLARLILLRRVDV